MRGGSGAGNSRWTIRRWLTLLGVMTMMTVPSGVLSVMAQSPPAATGIPAGSKATILTNDNVQFFIDPNSNARRQAEAWRATRPDDAAAMMTIADRPQADWFGGWVPDIREDVDARVTEITKSGAVPVLVAYDLPYRDCGQYSAGGQNDPEGYQAWIQGFAEGIGDRPAVVILEPDGLPLTGCLDDRQRAERFALIAFAVETFEARPTTDVYIDAGHSAWLPPEEAARRLMLAGIGRATGFSLNVSNFQRTDDLIAYGKTVVEAIGAEDGTHFVIDTSRNGNGPWEADDPETWCNPPGRALGETPTVETADPLVDAYLWIKRPGESDGSCRGAPVAGEWFPDYALELVRNASASSALPSSFPIAGKRAMGSQGGKEHVSP